MKKLLSVFLCLVVLFSIGTISATAATNYCDLFESNIRNLRWSVELNGQSDVSENQSFNMDAIFDYTKGKLFSTYYKPDEEYLYIPASIFESKAQKLFAKIDVQAMRTHKVDFWNMETEQMDSRQCYDAQKNAYVFVAAGGVGDSTTYVIKGYIKNGSKYTVYSYFIDQAGDDVPATAVEGKDYIVYNDVKCAVIHYLKNVVETDGTDVKFHSWQKMDTIPTVSGLIVPGAKVEDDKPTTSTPTQSTPATSSKPAASKPATSTPVTSTTESEPASSDETASTEEEKPLVTVAETTTAKLETEANVFPEDTVVKVEEIKETQSIETIKTAVKNIAEKFVAYEITATSKNVSVQPNGKVKATFDIPQGYDLNKVAVFYVSDNGETEAIPSTVDKETNTVVAELAHFSTYIVAEKIATENTESTITIGADTDKTDKNNNSIIIWVIIIAALIILLGGAALWYFLYFRKKQ